MALRDELLNGSADRQTIISFPNNSNLTSITSGIYSGSMSLEEILCSSEEITFGECNATKFEVTVSDIGNITGEYIYVYQQIGEYTVDIFTGYVDSCKKAVNKSYRKIIAYDLLYKVSSKNVAGWYNAMFPDVTTAHTVKQLRESLCNYVGIPFLPATFTLDTTPITKTITTSSLRFDDMLKKLCEINHCFAHVSRTGFLTFFSIDTSATAIDLTDNYRKNDTEYETFISPGIDRVDFYDSEGNLATTTGTGNNIYSIKDNFLLVDKTVAQLNTIGNNIILYSQNLSYVPIDMNLIISEPNLQLGQKIRFTDSQGNTQTSYILRQTLSDVQLLKQNIVAEGCETRQEVKEEVDTQFSIILDKIAVAQTTATDAQSTATDALSVAQSAQSASETAQSTANGKNTVYYQTTAPTDGTYKINDIWFDTDNDNKMYYWNGTRWNLVQFGKDALADGCITANHIIAGAITAAKVNLQDLFAQSITFTGDLTGGSQDGTSLMKSYNYSFNSTDGLTGLRMNFNTGTVHFGNINVSKAFKMWDSGDSPTNHCFRNLMLVYDKILFLCPNEGNAVDYICALKPVTARKSLQSGYVIITPVANQVTTMHVDFQEEMIYRPNVLTTLWGTVPGTGVIETSVSSITKTGFNLHIYATNTTARNVCWFAHADVEINI